MSDQPRNFILPDGTVLPVEEISRTPEPIVMPERVQRTRRECSLDIEIHSVVYQRPDVELYCSVHGRVRSWGETTSVPVEEIREAVVAHYQEYPAPYLTEKAWGIA